MNPAASPVARRENRVEPHPAAPGGAVRARFDDGRWHFQHGPIDLILGADGDPAAVDRTIAYAWTRFQGVLAELVSELELLRMPVQDAHPVKGPVARRMVQACWPHRERFITPMAAVAGAVADELIAFFRADERIRRACINNGGDIALHLTPGESYRVGLYADLGRIERRERHRLDGDFEVRSDLPVRGVATSGWRGRSFSLGIADSVTVLARNAAEADAAATMVANSVNIEDPAILRRPACDLKDDTDLGGRLVTVSVGTLSADRVGEALDAGASAARELIQRGEIFGAGLWLQGQVRSVGCEDGVR